MKKDEIVKNMHFDVACGNSFGVFSRKRNFFGILCLANSSIAGVLRLI